MKRKTMIVLTALSVLFSLLIALLLITGVVPRFVELTCLEHTQWIRRNNSSEIEERYGEFDITQTEPDASGLYRDTICSYVVRKEKSNDTSMLLFSIRFDENGIAYECYFEEGGIGG